VDAGEDVRRREVHPRLRLALSRSARPEVEPLELLHGVLGTFEIVLVTCVERSDSTAPKSRTFCLIQLLCETSARRRTSSSRVDFGRPFVAHRRRPAGFALRAPGRRITLVRERRRRRHETRPSARSNPGIRVLRSKLFDCGDAKGGRHPDVKLECPVHRPEGGGDQASLLAPGGLCARGVRSGLRARHRLERGPRDDDAPEAGSVSDDDAAQAAASAATTAGPCSPAAGTATTSAPAGRERGSTTSSAASCALQDAAACPCGAHSHARAASRQKASQLAQAPSREATSALSATGHSSPRRGPHRWRLGRRETSCAFRRAAVPPRGRVPVPARHGRRRGRSCTGAPGARRRRGRRTG
jgi:hypothetical protein